MSDDREHQLHPLTEDAANQAIRVVTGGMSDDEYQRNGGIKCPYCKAEDACYHDDFYLKDIPCEGDHGTELHASVCDKCSGTWFDVVDTETGDLLGTRRVDYDQNPLAVLNRTE